MQLTQPTEPQFHRGIWAWDDANDEWVQLQIDTATGALHVNVKSAVLPTGAAKETTLVSIYWLQESVRNNILRRFGYNDTVLETQTLTVTGAGTNNLDFTAVAANYINVVTNIAAMCSTTNPALIHFYSRRSGTSYGLKSETLATASFLYNVQGWWVLKAADQIRVSYTSCNVGDVLTAHINGFTQALTT